MDAMTAVPPAAAVAPWPSRRRANWVLAVLIVAFAFSFLDRVILTMLIVPIQRDLALTDVQLALLHGFAFAVFYALAGFPLGRLADRVSRKRLIAAGVAAWSLFTAGCGLAKGFYSLFFARVGVGVGEAALSPAAFSLLSDYFPPERRARAIATYQLGAIGGSGIAYVLGGLVIAFASSGGLIAVPLLGGMAPWQVTFLIVGLPGLAVALLVLTLKEPVRRESMARARRPRGQLRAWLRTNARTMICFVFGFSAINVSFNALIAWGPTWLMRVHDLPPAKIGLLLGAAMLLAGGGGQLLGAWRSDRLLARGRTTAVFDTGLACALILIPLSVATLVPGAMTAVLLVAAVLFFGCAAIGHAPSLIGQIAPNELRGQVAAIFLCAMNIIGAGVGSFTVALLTQHVFGDPKMVGASIGITAAIGAGIGAILIWSGRDALAQSAARLARSVKEYEG